MQILLRHQKHLEDRMPEFLPVREKAPVYRRAGIAGLQRIRKKLQNLLPGDFSKWDLFLGRGIFIKLSRQDLAGPG